ncbi:MAG TPA: hypothetical protein VMS64_25790 [Candidatus Methylomirabilis sp.]|nr:hypothetical protein [Candidatus Methylomirabilis sp.]
MIRVLAVAVLVLVVFAGPAGAFQCPLLIQQLTDAVATMNAADPKVKEGQRLIAEAKALHEAGKHADSIATAEKAAKVLGVPLKLSKMTPAQEEQVRGAEQKILK